MKLHYATVIIVSLCIASCTGQQKQSNNKMDNPIQQTQAVYSPMYENAYKNENMAYYEAIFKRYGYKTPDAQLFQQKVWEYCGIDISKASGNDAPFYMNDSVPVPIIIDKRFILLFKVPFEGITTLADIASGDEYFPARATVDINKIIFYDDPQAISDLIFQSVRDHYEYIKWLVLYLKYEKTSQITNWAIRFLSNLHDSDSLVISNILFYHFSNKPEKQRFRRELVRKFLYQNKNDVIKYGVLGDFLIYKDENDNDNTFELKGFPFTQDEKDYYKCLFLEEELAVLGNSKGNDGIGDTRSVCYSDTAFSQRIAQKHYYGLPLLNVLSQVTSLVYTTEDMNERDPSIIDIDFPDLPDKTLHGVINDSQGYVDVLKDKNDYTNKVTKITKGEEFVYWEDKNSDWWQVMTLNRIYGYIPKSEIVKMD